MSDAGDQLFGDAFAGGRVAFARPFGNVLFGWTDNDDVLGSRTADGSFRIYLKWTAESRDGANIYVILEMSFGAS